MSWTSVQEPVESLQEIPIHDHIPGLCCDSGHGIWGCIQDLQYKPTPSDSSRGISAFRGQIRSPGKAGGVVPEYLLV